MLFSLNYRLIRISPFANRLSFDAPPAIQRLRCLANFEALKFSKSITTLSNTLISRMRGKSAENNGKYVAVHLRFEEVNFLYKSYRSHSVCFPFLTQGRSMVIGQEKFSSIFSFPGYGCLLLLRL
jgi:hypothetical protein